MNIRRTATALAAGLALAAAALGLTGTAHASPGTPVTTTFSYSANSPVLKVQPSNLVPPKDTIVTLDLTARFTSEQATSTLATVNQGVYPAVQALIAAGVPALDIANAPLTPGQAAVAGTDTVVTLYVVHATTDSFWVSGVKGGVAVKSPGSGTETVSWTQAPAPVKAARPHLYNGHVITVNNNDAQIGWNYGPGVTCALTRTFGYGFTVNGSPHQGFTCFNASKPQDLPDSDTGEWSGLAAGHTYDIEMIPAGADRQPLPHAQVGWITVVTTR